MNKRYLMKAVACIWLMTMLSITGCGQKAATEGNTETQTQTEEERVDTGFVVTNPDSYDSADTADLDGSTVLGISDLACHIVTISSKCVVSTFCCCGIISFCNSKSGEVIYSKGQSVCGSIVNRLDFFQSTIYKVENHCLITIYTCRSLNGNCYRDRQRFY